jgi:uncharacterized membrane protein YgcG
MYVAGPVAAASSVTFGTPSATSTFGKSIVFTQPFSGATIKSATILIQTPWPPEAGPTALAVSGASSPLSFTMPVAALLPNMQVVAQFELELTDGTVEDGPVIRITYADTRVTWKLKTGSIVRLHYAAGTDAFAQQMLKWANDGVTKAAAFLGVPESQPIDFFVYASASLFQSATGLPGTAGGEAFRDFRTCFVELAPGDSQYGPDVLPHEATHVVFEDGTANPYHTTPHWLDEGFARYLSIGYDAQDRQLVSAAAQSGTLMPLSAFTYTYPMDAQRIYLAYAEGVSSVDFMVRKYGQAAIQKMVKSYAGGATDDEAFTAAFGIDVDGFDQAWMTDNGATASKLGPQPAPTGPLPPGWNGSSGGSGATPKPSGSGGPGGSSGTSGGSEQPKGSNTVVLVLAALLAAAGFTMVALSYVLISQARR